MPKVDSSAPKEPKPKVRRLKPQLRAVMSVSDIAGLLGISRFRAGRMLKAARVPFRRVGSKRLVYLSDLKDCMPSLWENYSR